MLRVWLRLERGARLFLSESPFGLTPSGRVYLTYLLGRAARNVVLDGAGNDPEALELAERRVEELLASAAGASMASEGSYLNLHAGPGTEGSGGRIAADDLRRALRAMGPVWPFVRRHA